RHTHDLQMSISQVIPKDDGESSGNVAIQIAPILVSMNVVCVICRVVANGLESAKQKIAFALSQTTEEFDNRRINQQPPFHSPAGSGIFSSFARASSSVSH